MTLKKLIATTLLGGALLANAGKVKADPWDGYRGPNDMQLDTRLKLTEGKPNMTLLPKTFIPLGKSAGDESGGLFGVVPVTYTLGDNPAVGVGVGGWYQFKHGSVLGVSPVVYDTQNKVLNWNPTLYATFQGGKQLLIDLRASYLLQRKGETTTHMVGVGTTVGLRLSERVLLGFDLDVNINPENATLEAVKDGLRCGGVLRVETVRSKGKPEQWLELYANNKFIGAGYRVNFDLWSKSGK